MLNLAFNTFDDVRDSLALSGTALWPAEKSLLAAYESDGVPVRGLLNLAHAQLKLDERPFV